MLNHAHLSTTTSFYQHPIGDGTPNGIESTCFAAYPSLAYDSWVTIGLDQVPDLLREKRWLRPFRSIGKPWFTQFDPGGGVAVPISSSTLLGGAWYALNGDSNGLAGVDKRVLSAQVTTMGTCLADLYCPVFPEWVGADDRAICPSSRAMHVVVRM